jgi:hypothetical protein
MQDKWENDLVMKMKAKKAHKEATILYNRERQKENNGGMSVRKVEEFIKAKHAGVGPSQATIHHYVVEPPMYAKWTNDDERELLEASKMEITLNDTALGRVQQQKKSEFMQAIQTLTWEEWADVMLKREIAESSLNSSDNGMG